MSEERTGPAGWHRVEGPGVRLDVPADVSSADDRGVEGPSLTLDGPGMKVILDGSPFADTLERYAGQADFSRHDERIGDRDAEVVSFSATDGTRVLGTRVGALTAVVHLSPDRSEETGLRVLRSIRPISEERR